MKQTKTFTAMLLLAAMLLTACGNTRNDESNSRSERKEKDVEEQTTLIRNGDYIVFGHYEQDNNTDNGPEPIEWEIISEQDGKMLLISRYIIDLQPYNPDNTDVTWETSYLRGWLNNEFINAAFNEAEQGQILTVTLSNPDNKLWGTEGGNDTEDKVFCLSVEEVLNLYEFNVWDEDEDCGLCQALMAEATPYVRKNDTGGHTRRYYEEDYNTFVQPYGYTDDLIGHIIGTWWLRTPGHTSPYASYVNDFGQTGWYCYNNYSYNNIGVRPALYLSTK